MRIISPRQLSVHHKKIRIKYLTHVKTGCNYGESVEGGAPTDSDHSEIGQKTENPNIYVWSSWGEVYTDGFSLLPCIYSQNRVYLSLEIGGSANY